ncbi:MAG: RNA polymerase sigma factor [Fimbriimonadaceae bacterium]|nr:RNA polymerase sigma factor [Fimbriimonadaceae bacterium]
MATDTQKLISTLYDSGQSRALKYAMRLTRNREDAEDLVQEALFRACRAIKRSAEIAAPEAWLCLTVRRLFLDSCRRKGRRPNTVSLHAMIEDNPAVEPSGDELNPEQQLLTESFSPQTESALAALSPEDRAVLISLATNGQSGNGEASRKQINKARRSFAQAFAQNRQTNYEVVA